MAKKENSVAALARQAEEEPPMIVAGARGAGNQRQRLRQSELEGIDNAEFVDRLKRMPRFRPEDDNRRR